MIHPAMNVNFSVTPSSLVLPAGSLRTPWQEPSVSGWAGVAVKHGKEEHVLQDCVRPTFCRRHPSVPVPSGHIHLLLSWTIDTTAGKLQ